MSTSAGVNTVNDVLQYGILQKVSILTEVELETHTADVESRAREPHDYERGVRRLRLETTM